MGSDCCREHEQSLERMSFGFDRSGSPHAYANVKVHEEAREHSSCIIVLKYAMDGREERGRKKTSYNPDSLR